MNIDNVIENLQFLDDWESRYRYIISLGENMPVFPEKYKTNDYKVTGCISQVWLYPEYKNQICTFYGDSDAKIVRGLIAIILVAINQKTKDTIKKIDFQNIFQKLALNSHLSMNRRNGFFSMITKINEFIQ